MSDHCVEANRLRSGDLGDFASFVTHMKQVAIVSPFLLIIRGCLADQREQEKDVDLLLVDSGDLHDGKYSQIFS